MTDLIAKLRRCGIDDAADEIESLRKRLAERESECEAACRGHDAAHAACVKYDAQLAEADALLRPCPNCGMALALCYDAKRTGKIACCPDCRHDAAMGESHE